MKRIYKDAIDDFKIGSLVKLKEPAIAMDDHDDARFIEAGSHGLLLDILELVNDVHLPNVGSTEGRVYVAEIFVEGSVVQAMLKDVELVSNKLLRRDTPTALRPTQKKRTPKHMAE